MNTLWSGVLPSSVTAQTSTPSFNNNAATLGSPSDQNTICKGVTPIQLQQLRLTQTEVAAEPSHSHLETCLCSGGVSPSKFFAFKFALT